MIRVHIGRRPASPRAEVHMGWGLERSVRARLASALGAGTLVMSLAVAGPAGGGVSDCPEIMPVDQVQDGMIGVGYTVVRGTEPVAFEVEVLGVQPGGIGPGRDLIVIKAKGPDIRRAGGIWAGMSGSPVYVDGDLIGAVAYGYSYGPSKIGGVTPAEDMADVLDYGGEDAAVGRVSLSESMRHRIARESNRSTSEVASSFDQLTVPVSVSGLNRRGAARLQRVLNRGDWPMKVVPGATAAPTPQGSVATLEPGSNFAAALSYGDVTLAGIGTTTMVCNGHALAFGHPFFFDGETEMGASSATAITIVQDPQFGPYKLANVTDVLGTVDQDRWAAIRADLTDMPELIPITSSVNALNTSLSRDGQTDVATSEPLSYIAYLHLFSNIDSVFDEIGQGSSNVAWTITGVDSNGEPWALTRSNAFASHGDISLESGSELYAYLYFLFYNDFEEIEFTGVDVTATVDDEVRQYQIAKTLTSKNGGPFKDRQGVRVRPGAVLDLRIKLLPYDSPVKKVVEMSLKVPKDARRSGYIQVSGGSDEDFYYCLYEDECGDSGQVNNLDDLISMLEDSPKNNELRARMRLGRKNVDSASKVLDQVVGGYDFIRVRLAGDRRGEPGGY
jgi:SpoIVB peptidase S55